MPPRTLEFRRAISEWTSATIDGVDIRGELVKTPVDLGKSFDAFELARLGPAAAGNAVRRLC
jgi:hypothetical protein